MSFLGYLRKVFARGKGLKPPTFKCEGREISDDVSFAQLDLEIDEIIDVEQRAVVNGVAIV